QCHTDASMMTHSSRQDHRHFHSLATRRASDLPRAARSRLATLRRRDRGHLRRPREQRRRARPAGRLPGQPRAALRLALRLRLPGHHHGLVGGLSPALHPRPRDELPVTRRLAFPRIATAAACLGASLLVSGCLPLNEVECDATCEASWLDGNTVRDTADLVSQRLPSPDSATLAKPVIIAAHGFTASTYEWEEFQRYAEADGRVLVSRVLLGRHGTDIEDFEAGTWRDWGRPILEEYRA